MPENAVAVDRSTKWGNPFPIGLSRDACLDQYRRYMESSLVGIQLIEEARTVLRGKNLACWCPLDKPCHADILLELANK